MPNRTSLLLAVVLVVVNLGCNKESPPAAAPPSAPAAAAAPAAKSRPSPASQEELAAAFAKGLTEDKVQRILAYENELLPHTHLLMGVALKGAARSGGDADKMAQELSRDERAKKLQEVVEAAFAKAGITQADVTGFTLLTTSLYSGEMALGGAREALATDPEKQEKWKAIEAEAAKLSGGEKFKFLQDHAKDRPMADYMRELYQKQLADHEQVRRDFAAKHGAEVLALVDKYQPQFVEIRQKQMDVALGK